MYLSSFFNKITGPSLQPYQKEHPGSGVFLGHLHKK